MTPIDAYFGLAFVGFGEAGSAFAAGWRDDGRELDVSAYDIKSDDPSTRDAMAERYAEHGIAETATAGKAVEEARAVFSVVTADQACAAAEAAAPGLRKGTFWLDCNSCAPQTKAAAAAVIEGAGGRYVDVAVMAPVHPNRHKVPLLVSGPHARKAETLLMSLGMRPDVVGDEIGQASSIKMLRSVMIKGLEALFAECLLAARISGVDGQVLASLEASDPDILWRERATYTLERMMVHGERRSAEMREVAKTVATLGLPPHLSGAIADWQKWVADKSLPPGPADLEHRLDVIVNAMRHEAGR